MDMSKHMNPQPSICTGEIDFVIHSSPSPILPESIRQDDPHDLPVAQRTLLMPLGQRGRVVPPQDVHLPDGGEVPLEHLVLGHQEVLPCAALQHVGGRGLAEGDGAAGILDAEEDHVCEVTLPIHHSRFISGLLAEDAAGGEDLPDGLEYYLGWGEGEVACVVLEVGFEISMCRIWGTE